jgi:hypothetical protein
MGALFLRHRVEQSGDDVEKINHIGGKSGSSRITTKRSCPVQRRMRQCHGRKEADRTVSLNHADATSDESASERAQTQANSSRARSGERCGQLASKIIVADASLLIYSLRTVHDWLKAGDCRVVIPCEALSTLDVLKKGEHVLNMAARRATRFLDERFSAVESFEVDGSQSGRTLSAGLYPQSMQQREDPHADSTKAKLIALGASPDAILAAPLHIQKTLSCFVHFALRAASDNEDCKTDCSIAIALPPPHLDYDDVSAQDKATLRYAERADGKLVMQSVNMLGLTGLGKGQSAKLIIAPTAASWLTAQSSSDARSLPAAHHHHHQQDRPSEEHNRHSSHQPSLRSHRIHAQRHTRHANARQC